MIEIPTQTSISNYLKLRDLEYLIQFLLSVSFFLINIFNTVFS